MQPLAATNNEQPAPSRSLWLLGALLAVAGLRLWRLPEAGPPDFDSVLNWQIVQQVAHGDFANLFQHGSPGFFLLYAPVALFTRDFLVFQTINALMGVVALGFFCGWVSQRSQLAGPETAALAALAGTSLLLTFAGRDFTMNAVDLLVFARLLRSHFQRLQRPSATAILRVAGWLALGLCFDYKFLFAVPILGVLELGQADGLWRQRGTWGRVLLVLLVPFVALGALGVAAGLPWYRWLAFYVRVVVPAAANPAGRQLTLDLDLLYYFRYLLRYESPLLLAGLVVAAWQVWRSLQAGTSWRVLPTALLPYLLVWAVCLVGGMSLLVKAPRGLLFAYTPLAALVVLSMRRVVPGWALVGGVLVAVGLNLRLIQSELLAPLPSPYAKVGAWLQAHGATKVASTVGLGLAPYLDANQRLTVVYDERELASLRRQGYQYVLLDGYWRVAGVHRFDSLRRQLPVAAWPAPQLHSPLLFLEHSEYTGLGFERTLAAARRATADTLALRLYRLQ
ncbi:hypothetical protein BEN47_08595 [Hymenobacter lapidarius]|uniref:Glycosyltransferase RgtA/B/C/D-like domain-containing protein n=1 Tax=Hymenobacter lapidarius TaxID=1908237 RepID=A0A1G1TD59_9BACT|nr:hypothetical protein [Hymenobacter lapidarius]OGX88790.1 hypothetical protein BEN47_08595 [Hymenobacter lapidarius]